MKTYRVEWKEYQTIYYSTEVTAENEEDAKLLIDEDIDGSRTEVITEDHSEVTDWEITFIHEK